MDGFVEFAGTGLRYAGYLLLPFLLLPIAALIAPKPLRKVSKHIAALLDRISGSMMQVAIAVALLIIFIQLLAVLLRYVFGLSFSWMTDSIVFAFASIFMLGAAGTLRADGHVRVDILRSAFGQKTQDAIELVGSLLFIMPIGVLILYSGSGLIARSWADLEPFNESDGLPVKYLFKTLVPVFAVLLMSQGLSQAIKAAFGVRGTPLEPHHDHQHGGPI